jgi:hypothetical protein
MSTILAVHPHLFVCRHLESVQLLRCGHSPGDAETRLARDVLSWVAHPRPSHWVPYQGQWSSHFASHGLPGPRLSGLCLSRSWLLEPQTGWSCRLSGHARLARCSLKLSAVWGALQQTSKSMSRIPSRGPKVICRLRIEQIVRRLTTRFDPFSCISERSTWRAGGSVLVVRETDRPAPPTP